MQPRFSFLGGVPLPQVWLPSGQTTGVTSVNPSLSPGEGGGQPGHLLRAPSLQPCSQSRARGSGHGVGISSQGAAPSFLRREGCGGILRPPRLLLTQWAPM